MPDFIVSIGSIGFLGEGAHFNTPEFLGQLNYDKKISFEFHFGKKKLFIAFVQTDELTWTSLPSSTFGGFESNDKSSLDLLIQFIGLIEKYFLQNSLAKILKIHLPPTSSGYHAAELQFYSLYTQGYLIENCNLSYCLPIQGFNFNDLVSQGNLKRIKKCIREGCVFHVAGVRDLSAVYEVISLNRAFKGYPMTLSYSQLLEQVQLFPSKFKFFCYKLNDEIIASAVAIKITANTLYVLYWGDVPEYRSYSPIVSLCKNIYDYCNENKIDYLDIGTATVDKEPNFGLIDFKSDLGFSPNLKFTMQKVIKI
ncbi:hypothetical protein [Polynucleobacter sp. AP-Kolm-20A-A1]|uniref:hypothetical protein n=1 Tax=Polynucleobacter sp. AP-Kolm-20A-A1 TaxID=2081041 RepID=UPI001BFE1F8A|nr:hypothetical protein [Polynucleobacter sp. AP-Kolm-20A-A1]QWE20933.1 hypothetical protein C2745_01700 [Polynucleobacter sp. AP-Kolm-20A-A1]